MTRTPLSRSKGQRSGSQGRGHIMAASRLQLVNSTVIYTAAVAAVFVQTVT